MKNQAQISELKAKLSLITPKKGVGKSLLDLINQHPEFKDSWLCNEDHSTPLTKKISLEWDKNHSCVGLYVGYESYLNLDEDFISYNNSQEGFSLLEKAFNFFTKSN